MQLRSLLLDLKVAGGGRVLHAAVVDGDGLKKE